MRTLRPSTPSLYWMPKAGIQSTVSLNWKPAGPKAKATSRTSESPQAARANARAVRRMSSSWRDGRAARTSAPARGVKVIRLRIGRRHRLAPPTGRDQEVADGHRDQPEGDAEGVVLDAPRLDAAEPQAGPASDGADAVDRAVDDHPVEPPDGAGEPAAPVHEEQVVEVVEPPLGRRAAVQEGQAAPGADFADPIGPRLRCAAPGPACRRRRAATPRGSRSPPGRWWRLPGRRLCRRSCRRPRSARRRRSWPRRRAPATGGAAPTRAGSRSAGPGRPPG